jgi:hypothetical protein
MLDKPAFGQGKFVRVYGHQGKLDKCTRNTSMVFWQTKLGGLEVR